MRRLEGDVGCAGPHARRERTRRRRKRDSNRWSPPKKDWLSRASSILRGTEGSNPLSSSGESTANSVQVRDSVLDRDEGGLVEVRRDLARGDPVEQGLDD